ncbi:MAG TPA: PTS sugar transporter subunit IIA [Spirochaetia bacterium]|nr:PTS sugar transporter subunit IIA [Spirochaetia bacterium]
MELSSIVRKDRILYLESAVREDAFRELAECAHRTGLPGSPLDCDALFERVQRREEQFTTRISSTIAIPHVIIPGLTTPAIVFGVARRGIVYDSGDEGPVYLLVLLLSDRKSHIELLSQLARLLQRDELLEQLISSENVDEAVSILLKGPVSRHRTNRGESLQLSQTTFEHALEMAEKTGVRAVILNADSVGTLDFVRRELAGIAVYLVTNDPDQFDRTDYGFRQIVTVPFRGMTRTNLVELSLLFILSRGLLEKGDKVLNVFGTPGCGYLDTILYTDVEWEFRIFFAIHGTARPVDLQESVFSRAILLAQELATEGREGKPAGSLFVLGDSETVAQYCQQLVLNPFQCYPEEERNILDPSLQETIKEYSRIDGAFIIRGDGVVVSAGTFLRTELPFASVEPGLGARHAAAASISKVTRAVCVVISESTKKISLFRAGERVMVI